MRSRASVTGSAAAGPSWRARRHNLKSLTRKVSPVSSGRRRPFASRRRMSSTGPQRSTPCSRWYPEPLRGEVRFDRLDEPTGESTSELLHSHDLDATRFPSRGFHARHVARKSGVHHNCAARRHGDLLNQGSGRSEPVALLRHVKAYYMPASLLQLTQVKDDNFRLIKWDRHTCRQPNALMEGAS